MEKHIQELLNSIPQGVTYTTFPEELEPEDISQERIDGLKKLLTHEDVFIELCAAKLLCAWGIDEGFKALIQLYEAGKTERFQEVTQHPKRLGMHQALNYLKIPLVGTHHRGKDDAYNIAKIMYRLITNPLEQN